MIDFYDDGQELTTTENTLANLVIGIYIATIIIIAAHDLCLMSDTLMLLYSCTIERGVIPS